MKVLIADDERITLIALKRHLEKWGYEVVKAGDGREAWNTICEDDPPRIALLDWMMPEMEGIEICERIQKSDKLPFIYTILLTTRRDKEDIVNALDSGAHDFLSKPVHTGELRARIAVGVRLVEAKNEVNEYAKKMERLAITDYLTGVYNLRYFMEMAVKELDRCKRYGGHFSLLSLDIDHFKRINDTYSHLAGDAALQTLTGKLQSILRKNDLLARLGGEEFSVLLPETGRKEAFELAERLRRKVEEISIDFEGRSFGFTVSIGVTEAIENDATIEQVQMRADNALYSAKENGRNCTKME